MTSSKVRKIEMEMKLESPVEKLWNALKESSTIFPKAIPHIYHNIQTIKGDGKSVGSIRLINYVEGKSIGRATEKIESVDEEGKAISYSIIDGHILKFYKDFKYSIDVVPEGDGCVVILLFEYKIAREESPSTPILRDFPIINLKDIDEYLLQN